MNEDYATQVDEGYSSIVPAKEEADPTFSGSVRNHQADDSTAKSTSTFTMEDYYRAWAAEIKKEAVSRRDSLKLCSFGG